MSTDESSARAREATEKALAIDPGYAHGHAMLGWIAMTFGNDLNMASDQIDAGRLDKAIASLCTGLSPSRGVAHFLLGLALLHKDDPAGALVELERETSEFPRMTALPMAYHAPGRKADSDKALAEVIAKYENDPAYYIAYFYAFRGEADKAFGWLDKSVLYGPSGLSSICVDILFANIHSDPRWPFLRKLGKAPEQLARIKLEVSLPARWWRRRQSNPCRPFS